jgi:mannose-6-phosphate isomerase-like protein (cupin superfamily)
MVLVANRPGIKLPMRSMTDDEFYIFLSGEPQLQI